MGNKGLLEKPAEFKVLLNVIKDAFSVADEATATFIEGDPNSSEVPPGSWILEGFASTDNLDLQGDIISPDAIKNSQSDLIASSTVLYNHDINCPIGRVLDSKFVDGDKLWIKVLISKTEPDKWVKIQEGVLNKFSIRGNILKAEQKWSEQIKDYVRVVTKMELLEVSVVTLPANIEAKSLRWYMSKALDKVLTEKGGNAMSDTRPVSSGISTRKYSLRKNLELLTKNIGRVDPALQDELQAMSEEVAAMENEFSDLKSEKEKQVAKANEEAVVQQAQEYARSTADGVYSMLKDELGVISDRLKAHEERQNDMQKMADAYATKMDEAQKKLDEHEDHMKKMLDHVNDMHKSISDTHDGMMSKLDDLYASLHKIELNPSENESEAGSPQTDDNTSPYVTPSEVSEDAEIEPGTKAAETADVSKQESEVKEVAEVVEVKAEEIPETSETMEKNLNTESTSVVKDFSKQAGKSNNKDFVKKRERGTRTFEGASNENRNDSLNSKLLNAFSGKK